MKMELKNAKKLLCTSEYSWDLAAVILIIITSHCHSKKEEEEEGG